jgi:hypothetical protein
MHNCLTALYARAYTTPPCRVRMERRAERRDGASGGSHPTQARACVNCQRRKTRCHRGKAWNEPCSFCARTGKTCSFESPPDRTPLTRKNLEAAEGRCARLEKLLRSLNPDVDIDLALKSSGAQNGGQAGAGGDGEVDNAPPHHYDWHEVALSPEDEPGNDGNDGMAVFATGDTGYLGESSRLFRCLSTMADLTCLSRKQLWFPDARRDRSFFRQGPFISQSIPTRTPSTATPGAIARVTQAAPVAGRQPAHRRIL